VAAVPSTVGAGRDERATTITAYISVAEDCELYLMLRLLLTVFGR
jgi:hypothetical protein